MTVMVELAQPRPLIPRWPSHGDLHLTVDGPYIWVAADDVHRLAGIQPLSDDGALIAGDDWPDINGAQVLPFEEAMERCEKAGTPLALEFATWARTMLATLLNPTVLDQAQRVTSFIHALPVRKAAAALSSDGIRIGQTGLFQILSDLGWITRPAVEADWEITPTARRADLLTLRGVPVPTGEPGKTRVYQQVHVTPAGLTRLRDELRPDATPPQPPLPIFD